MSTKIYDGLKLKGNMSFFEVNELMRRVRKEAEKIQTQHYNMLVTEYATHLVDESTLFSKEDLMKKHDLSTEICRPISQVIYAEQDDQPWRKCQCNVLLFPVEGHVLALISGHSIFRGLFFDSYEDDKVVQKRIFEEFEEFGYWNNTDMPEDITEDDWMERRRLWDEALHNIGIPLENGIVYRAASTTAHYNLLPASLKHEDYRNTELDLIGSKNCYYSQITTIQGPAFGKEEYIPSAEARIAHLIEEALIDQFDCNLVPKFKEDGLSSREIYSAFNLYRRLADVRKLTEDVILLAASDAPPKNVSFKIFSELYGEEILLNVPVGLPEIKPEYFRKINLAELYAE